MNEMTNDGVTVNEGPEANPNGVTTLLGGDPEPLTPEAGQQTPSPANAPRAPEQYEAFQLPEGVDANNEPVRAALDEAKALFKAEGISQQTAQKLIDLHMKHWMGGAVEAERMFEEEVTRRVKGWEEELQRDPEIGGTMLRENLIYAKRAVGYLGGKRLMDALNETGVGSHPAIVAAFVKVGRDFLREGRFITGNAASGAMDNSPEAIAMRFYPNMRGK